MKYSCTGVILAGGLNTRFEGRIKALLPVGGKRMLDPILEVFRQLFDEIVLVTNEPLKYLDYDLTMGADLFDIRSSLTGIHAGLFYATSPYCFISASDTPFLKIGLVRELLDRIEQGVDLIIPRVSKGYEPLCAVYSKRCLAPVTRHLEQENLKIRDFFKKITKTEVPEEELRKMDPELSSFININTPEEFEKVQEHF